MLPKFAHMRDALRLFASAKMTETQEHIRPLHKHISLRLVIEGGFLPEEVTPRPPLRAERSLRGLALLYDPEQEGTGEMTVFGGMKTKQVDVVVAKQGVGPVLAVSVKGTGKAYRNLVNRMEEAIGDSTNLHVMYPGLVYGFLSVLRANREAEGYGARDMGVRTDGTVSPLIHRYYTALLEMTGRRFVRDDFTRYEAVGVVLVENSGDTIGQVHQGFPPADSPLRVEVFFARLFDTYDLRFPSRAEHLREARRVAWRQDSPLFVDADARDDEPAATVFGYRPRFAP